MFLFVGCLLGHSDSVRLACEGVSAQSWLMTRNNDVQTLVQTATDRYIMCKCNSCATDDACTSITHSCPSSLINHSGLLGF